MVPQEIQPHVLIADAAVNGKNQMVQGQNIQNLIKTNTNWLTEEEREKFETTEQDFY